MLPNKERKINKVGIPIRVLIVEDSEDDTELMIRTLRKGGFNPKYKRVQSGRALEDALTSRKWDIILCDHKMPEFDSVSALEIVNEINSALPFLLVSGSISDDIKSQITNSGECTAITKDELHQLVPAVVHQIKRSRQENGFTNKASASKRSQFSSEARNSVPTKNKSNNYPGQSFKKSENGSNGNRPGNANSPLKTILIVEDELIQSILLEKLINNLGYNVIGKASSGADAIEMALDLQPDLITMDISLRDNIDGINATKSIQKELMIPVIYISGNSDKYNFDKAKQTYFVDFIPKPISIESLKKSIQKAETIIQNGLL